jgi:Zn-dependent protease with chaperone function
MPVGDSGGFLLSLVTESFAVRALLGSLAAAALAAALVGSGVVRSSRARRLVLLTPTLVAAVAAVGSFGEVYLPQLFVASASAAASTLLEIFGARSAIAIENGLDVLAGTYAVIVVVLLSRRALGLLAVRRTLRRSVAADPDTAVVVETRTLAASMGVRTPAVRLLARCPGGAFTTGSRRPVIAVDPVLIDRLDDRELEGLLAHELAHVACRDTTLGTLVGAFRDVAFFLPPLHLAARWLRREQEESADELASEHTGRPVALASSILKVWDCSRERRQLASVCAAVPEARASSWRTLLSLPGGSPRVALPSGVINAGHGGSGVRVITARVERLIAHVPAPSPLRRTLEVGLAVGVLAAGTSAALTVPGWIATDLKAPSLAFVYLSAPPAAPAESPAFATFRTLAPAAPTDVATTEEDFSAGPASVAGCPCVESQAQLRAGGSARQRGRSARLAWSSGRPAWEMIDTPAARTVQTARPLWRIGDAGSQVGFFLVGAAPE